jgi:uncharacterized protein YaiL (DUF2058 family)
VTVRGKQLAVVAVIAAVLGLGVGAAVAGGGLSNDREAFLNDVAKRLNVTPEQLQAAIKGATDARIDQAVKDGKITKEQGDELKKRAADGWLPFLGPGPGLGDRGGFGFRFGGPGPGRHLGGSLDAAATYLGLTEEQLRTQLASGKSLADITKATSGKTVDGLKKAMTADLQAKLDQAVKDKKLTQAQADEILKRTNDMLDDLVENTFQPGLHFEHHGFGGPMGKGSFGGGSRMIVPAPSGQPI